MKPKTSELLKFKRLMRRLDESLRGTVGLLELLWIGTAKNCPEGDVGRFTNEEIAIMCDWGDDPDKLVTALVETNWLDADPVYRLLVHDWPEHSPDYVRGNLKRWGKDFAIGTSPGKADASLLCESTSSPSLALPSQLDRSIDRPDVAEVSGECIAIAKKFSPSGRRLAADDRDTTIRAVLLARTHLGTDQFAGIVKTAARKHSRNELESGPFAYLQTSIKNALKDKGLNPHAEWRNVPIPGELAQPPPDSSAPP